MVMMVTSESSITRHRKPLRSNGEPKSLGKGLENPFFKGVFHDASMPSIEATGGTFLKKGFPQTPSKDF